MKGMKYEDWICFSVTCFVCSPLRPDFREQQYVFLQDTYVGLADDHYPDIKHVMYEFDNHSLNFLSKLSALMGSSDDQTAS